MMRWAQDEHAFARGLLSVRQEAGAQELDLHPGCVYALVGPGCCRSRVCVSGVAIKGIDQNSGRPLNELADGAMTALHPLMGKGSSVGVTALSHVDNSESSSFSLKQLRLVKNGRRWRTHPLPCTSHQHAMQILRYDHGF